MVSGGASQDPTCCVCCSCMQGLFGLGVGEARTAQLSVAHAYMKAFQNLAAVPLYRGHTLYHHVEHKLHHMKVWHGGLAVAARGAGCSGYSSAGQRQWHSRYQQQPNHRLAVAVAVVPSTHSHHAQHQLWRRRGLSLMPSLPRRFAKGGHLASCLLDVMPHPLLQ